MNYNSPFFTDKKIQNISKKSKFKKSKFINQELSCKVFQLGLKSDTKSVSKMHLHFFFDSFFFCSVLLGLEGLLMRSNDWFWLR